MIIFMFKGYQVVRKVRIDPKLGDTDWGSIMTRRAAAGDKRQSEVAPAQTDKRPREAGNTYQQSWQGSRWWEQQDTPSDSSSWSWQRKC